MKFILSILIIVFSITNLFAQYNPNVLNGYKYAVVEVLTYNNSAQDVWGISSNVMYALNQKGIKIIRNEQDFKTFNPTPTEIFIVDIEHSSICEGCGAKKVFLTFKNFKDETIYQSQGSGICIVGLQCEVDKATNKALSGINSLNYKFDPSLTPKVHYPEVERVDETETSIMQYFTDNYNNLNQIEGIYKSYQTGSMPFYKIGIKKRNNNYIAIIIASDNIWVPGEIKAYFEQSSMNGFYSVKWLNGVKYSEETFAKMENDAILSIEFKNTQTGEIRYEKFIKIYPASDISTSNNKTQKSSGSGFFLTTDGVIATNAHVVENANLINIQVSNELGNFEYKARVLLKDKNNDVALLKIEDANFKGLSGIPYSLNEKADIGEKAFTIGYPLNDVMGTNYKVTDGIISSISGIGDDMRYFQISVPIQPGNSGGPLFNNSGEVIGITSARLNSKAVGVDVENVNYAIKISYLLNLYNMLPNSEKLNSISSLHNKSLQEQVKVLKNYVCLIKVN
jgi:S1-C subfamily serine protease